jgi:hypothetical protein
MLQKGRWTNKEVIGVSILTMLLGFEIGYLTALIFGA